MKIGVDVESCVAASVGSEVSLGRAVGLVVGDGVGAG